MSEDNQQGAETLFVQVLSGHSFTLKIPALQSELSYAQLIMNIQTMGHMLCGEARIPWHAIAFIARGEMAQTMISASQQRQPISVASMTPQGVA